MKCVLFLAVMLDPAVQGNPGAVSSQLALQQLSEARPDVHWDATSGARADIDCDGRRDRAFLGRHEGRVYVGFVRAAAQTPEVMDFAIDAGLQAAICQEPAKLAIEPLDYDPSDTVGAIGGFRRSRLCKGLRLSGGDCDSIHLFWNHGTRRLEWWRA